MATNLRDRGYSSSMDGYTPKKQERHTRKKKVVSGEATVSKGQPAKKAELPSVERPSDSGTYTTNKTQVPLYFTDKKDQASHWRNAEVPYMEFSAERDAAPKNIMSLGDIKRRMQELEQAMARIDTGRTNINMRVFDGKQHATDPIPYFEHPAQPLADYEWNKHDVLDDYLPDVTDDPVALYLEQMNHAKAAATGKALRKQRDSAYYDALDSALEEENNYKNLFFEYNNLKNEYNTRLAQYLHSFGG